MKNYKKKARIVVGTIALVLSAGILIPFLITNYDHANKFNLNIFSNVDALGSTVFIDGIEKGKMKNFSEKNTRFGVWLANGKYQILVKHDDKILCKKFINVGPDESEYYLYCN